MKKISTIISLSFVCVLASAQVYFYNAQGLIAEYEDGPDSVIAIPNYRTPKPAQNIGALNGVFSVSNERKVRFSKGNLQYETTTGIWRFATNQYDTVGGDVTKQFIDLFGYGTSGWNGSGVVAYQPTATSTNVLDYTAQYAGATLTSLTGYMEQRDWGVHNPILNGGNQAGLWRLLTYLEVFYMMRYRWAPYAYGLVNNVVGIILLPDNWDESKNPNTLKVHPALKYDRNWKATTTLSEEEIVAILTKHGNDTLKAGEELGITMETSDFVEPYYDGDGIKYTHPLSDYNITPEEWLQYEKLGCVFLPFITGRNYPDNYVRDYGTWVNETLYAIYWTSTDAWAYLMYYRTPTTSQPSPLSGTPMRTTPEYVGGCVRLVQDY